jgi:transcriptional regulator with XRE-family HTH domain
MGDATTLGTWLRRERERRGVTLSQISEQTKLSVAILEGLEHDDLSRWPGGIFRRAYSRSYATAVGLDPDLIVRRVEEAHPVADADAVPVPTATSGAQSIQRGQAVAQAARPNEQRTRVLAVSLDLLVAGALGFGFAAAGSRLLWPVLAIAAYHALGLLLAGRSPMLALLTDVESAPVLVPAPVAAHEPSAPAPRIDRAQASAGRSSGRGHRQVSRRAARSARRA